MYTPVFSVCVCVCLYVNSILLFSLFSFAGGSSFSDELLFLFSCSFKKEEVFFVIVIRSGAVTIAASILPSLNETFFFFGLGFYWKQPPAPALDGYIYIFGHTGQRRCLIMIHKSPAVYLFIHPAIRIGEKERKITRAKKGCELKSIFRVCCAACAGTVRLLYYYRVRSSVVCRRDFIHWPVHLL